MKTILKMLVLFFIFQAIKAQNDVPPPIFLEPPPPIVDVPLATADASPGMPIDDTEYLTSSSEIPPSSTSSPETTQSPAETQASTPTETVSSNSNMTERTETDSQVTERQTNATVTESSTSVNASESVPQTESTNITITTSSPDSVNGTKDGYNTTTESVPEAHSTTVTVFDRNVTMSSANETSTIMQSSTENATRVGHTTAKSIVDATESVKNESSPAGAIPVEIVPEITDAGISSMTVNASEPELDQNVTDANISLKTSQKTVNETDTMHTEEVTDLAFNSKTNQSEPITKDNAIQTGISLVDSQNKTSNETEHVSPDAVASSSQSQSSVKTVDVSTTGTDNRTDNEMTQSSDQATSNFTTEVALIQPVTESMPIPETNLTTENVTDFDFETPSATTSDFATSSDVPEIKHALTELPNITATDETTIKTVPGDKVISLAIDPDIAMEIDPAIFDVRTIMPKDNQTMENVTKGTTESSITTTPIFNTTTVQELSVSDSKPKHEPVGDFMLPPVEPAVPDHPPPIMVIPSRQTESDRKGTGRIGPIIGRPSQIRTTTEAPPPPIIIPRRPHVRPIRYQPVYTTTPMPARTTKPPVYPYHKPVRSFDKTPSFHDPRYMTVSELAELALQQLNLARSHTRSTGLQVFFKPTKQYATTTQATTTTYPTTTAFRQRLNIPGDINLPWLQSQWKRQTTTIRPSPPTNQLFAVPDSGVSSNIWGTDTLWGQPQNIMTTTERPWIIVPPKQPRTTLYEPTQPNSKLFVAPEGAPISNIWGTGGSWGQMSVAKTTTELPWLHVRPIRPPPTVDMSSKTEPFRLQVDRPGQPVTRKDVSHSKPSHYTVFGSQDSKGSPDYALNVQPLVKRDQLFNLPSLEHLIPQTGRSKLSQKGINPLWANQLNAEPVIPNNDKLKLGSDRLTPAVTNIIPDRSVFPTKNLRTSQHDVRSFKKQPYHFFRPSINIAASNELDLFLRSNLARYTTKKVKDAKPAKQPTTRKPPINKPDVHLISSITRSDKPKPLSYEELLLKQLQGSSFLFKSGDKNMKSQTPKQPSKNQYPEFNINIEIPSQDSSVVVRPLDGVVQTTVATALMTTTTTSETTTIEIPETIASTPEPKAAEHPPPIFDSKVFKTFMPFPKDEATTRGTKDVKGTSDVRPLDDTTGIDHGTCKGCTFVNDRCLLPEPTHCNQYIECVKQGPAVRVFTRECALGSFFDRKSFLCVDPKEADCPTDRCREPGLKAYVIHGHCKHYWVCGSRKGGGIFAQAECCPAGGGFKEGEGCVSNPNCTESCDFSKAQDTIIGCKLRKTASPTEYFDENANIVRPCAPGTLFSEPKCTCVQDVTVERRESSLGGRTCECSQGIPVLNGDTCTCREATALEQLKAKAPTCSPVLNMTFDGGKIEDTSATRQHVSKENIAASEAGELITTAKGRLILWRYSNLIFSDIFAVRLNFKSLKAGPRFQTLVSNCDPKSGSEPSFDISVDTVYHEVVFSVNTYENPAKSIKIYYQVKKWSTVYLIYDGERIVAAVDGRVRNIFSGGRIETRPNPVGIGSCGTKGGLKGLVDDIAFFEDCIPDDMYEIFLNVLE